MTPLPSNDLQRCALLVGVGGLAYAIAFLVAKSALVSQAAAAGVPNAIDRRGVLTFGAGGISLFVFAWLIGRSGQFPMG